MISFFGGGNMASAMIAGLLARGHTAAEISVIEIDAAACARLTERFGVATTSNPEDALKARLIVLAVKPQQLEALAQSLSGRLTGQLIFSIAAGVTTAALSRWLGGYTNVVRAMPNTPAQIQAGLTGLYALAQVSADDRAAADALARAIGEVVWLPREADIDAITALSGSGPAYVFYFLEAMQEAAQRLGFDAALARRISQQTFIGASRLAEASDEDPGSLRARVTSKGGTTERAIASLEAAQVKAHFIAAIEAAHARAVELRQS